MITYTPLQLIPPVVPPITPFDPTPIVAPLPSTIAFDPYSDVLYVGDSSGLLSSFCSPLNLSRHATYPVHGSKKSHLKTRSRTTALYDAQRFGVRDIKVTEKQVWSLSDGGLGGRRRGGAALWKIDADVGLRTLTTNPTNSHEVLAGGIAELLLVNTSRGEVVKRFDQIHPVQQLRATSRHVISASPSGLLQVLDPRMGFRSNATLARGGGGGLSGIDVLGEHMVISWGWEMQAQPVVDEQIKVFDLRTNKALPSVAVEGGPVHARLHAAGKVVAITSSELQVLDFDGTIESRTSLDLGFPTSMAISPQGDYVAVGDGQGRVHLLTSHDISPTSSLVDAQGALDLPPMNGFQGRPVEWQDTPQPVPPIGWNSPLNVIGVPFYDTPLLSNFDASQYATHSSPLFNPPKPIPADLLNAMKMSDGIGYVTLPKEHRGKRNVVCADAKANIALDSNGSKRTARRPAEGRRESGPKFRSEKARLHAEEDASLEDLSLGSAMPKYYRRVEIKYSRFGIEDFDFDFYNKTQYSGLETHIANSYTNSVLQALHYTTPVRACAKAHIAVDCLKEHCLLCEAGFLFRMLEDARGVNCQASNFSRAFSFAPQAALLGLFVAEDEQVKQEPALLIQKFSRWLLTTFGVEDAIVPPCQLDPQSNGRLPPISQVMALTGEMGNTCLSCGNTSVKEFTAHVVDLLYPRASSTFASILRASLLRESTAKSLCVGCKRSAVIQSRRNLEHVPSVLCLNASILSSEHRQFWSKRPVPAYVRIRSAALEIEESNEPFTNSEPGDAVYSVRSVVAQVGDDAGHLVAYAKVETGDWMLFNDFLVRPVEAKEALTFDVEWKTPAIVILERLDHNLALDSLPQSVDPSILFKDVNMSRRRVRVQHKPLDTLPTKGTLIAIDAEFVALQTEELEIRSDGSRKVLRPTKMSLARVSVLRDDGQPFIDDYIHTSEKIVDYLTEFSGIKSGDLDPNHSPHTVVPLKVAYKKLRLLVDLGCIFIGHGLPKDFRTINIVVPSSQVVDTVSIYYDPLRHRKLSLRFLVWFLLKQEIQLAEHDSIEDARSALLLYKKYLTFCEEGRFADVLDDVYESGKRLGFKPPAAADGPDAPSSPMQSAPSTPEPGPRLPSLASYPALKAQGSHLSPSRSPSTTADSPRPSRAWPSRLRKWS